MTDRHMRERERERERERVCVYVISAFDGVDMRERYPCVIECLLLR